MNAGRPCSPPLQALPLDPPATATMPLRCTMVVALLLLTAQLSAAIAEAPSAPACAAGALPSPPTALRATPSDGAVTLSWAAPANGACVDAYVIVVIPLVDSTAPRAAQAPPLRLPPTTLTTTISELANGQRYRLFVQAHSAQFRAGGEAVVEAAPAGACNPAVAPMPPTQLTANATAAALRVCWQPPRAGCVSEYRLAARLAQPGAPTLATKRVPATQRCLSLPSLEPGASYEVAIQVCAGYGSRL